VAFLESLARLSISRCNLVVIHGRYTPKKAAFAVPNLAGQFITLMYQYQDRAQLSEAMIVQYDYNKFFLIFFAACPEFDRFGQEPDVRAYSQVLA
jgi:hypothetical protein